MEVPGVLSRVPQNYTMCTDGTFAVVPHQFTQMLLVLVTVNERLVPAYTGATYVRTSSFSLRNYVTVP